MKIYVYAICKNEEKNIRRWYESMKEADKVYVLDTGSTDNSVKLLKHLGAIVVKKEINPWRFDDARNVSLRIVPDDGDLYVCTDIDECFDKGWRKEIEKYYTKDYTRIKYNYNWSFDNDGKPATTFYLNKIHTKDYVWTHPVHEVLMPLKKEKELIIDTITLNHYQDTLKSRSNYLPLLEKSVEECPSDDRNMHYLGREYMYYHEYYKCIETLHKHLKMPSSTWKDERCASMRFMARSYLSLGFIDEARMWYQKSIQESPYLREGYVELASLELKEQNYELALNLLDKAFQIKEKSKSYINECFAWNAFVYDLYSICAYYTNKKDIAIKYSNIAISLSGCDDRIKNNNLLINQNCMNNEASSGTMTS